MDAGRELTYLIDECIIKESGFLLHLSTHLLPCPCIHFPSGFDDLHDVFPHHILMNVA